MMKSALQRMLDTELDLHWGRRGSLANAADGDSSSESVPEAAVNEPTAKPGKNRRNGHSQKTVKGDMGELRIEISRDRNSTFESVQLPPSSCFLPDRSAASVAFRNINVASLASMKIFC